MTMLQSLSERKYIATRDKHEDSITIQYIYHKNDIMTLSFLLHIYDNCGKYNTRVSMLKISHEY